ncbi:hypothetical protein OPQ81_002783 [Rhizoctonia solani]|nr:hypothetical protein OPQ81_002783 [Rhizoctonia solani]
MSHSQAHIPVDTASIIEATIEYVKDTFGRQLRDFHHEVFQCQMGCNGTATTSQMKQESMQEEINNLNRVVDAKMTSWNEMDEERDRLMEEMDRLMGELKAAGISHSQK